ncbi:hypothetical protein SHIRM173S_02367 [Streptomyces hirsutus]
MPEAPPDDPPALHVENIDVTYGRALSALRSVPHRAARRRRHPARANRAGKTTLLRACPAHCACTAAPSRQAASATETPCSTARTP